MTRAPRRGLSRGLIGLMAVGGGLVTAVVVVAAVLVGVHLLGPGGRLSRSSSGTASQPMVAVWLLDNTTPAMRNGIRADILVDSGVKSVLYVSRAQSMKEARSLPAVLRPGAPTAFFLVTLTNAHAASAIRRAVTGVGGVWAVKVST